MSFLVGYGPRNDDRSAIELALQLARSRPEPVIALSVVPRGWGTPAAGGTDREYELWAAEEGRRSTELARADFARHHDTDAVIAADAAIPTEAAWIAGRSVPATLMEQADEHGAWVIVVGSAEEAEPGRVRLSSKTDRLMHSSTLPVAIAPRSYRTSSAVTRITVAFRDDDAGWSLLDRVADLSRTEGARLRIVTFVVAPARTPVINDVPHAEAQVTDAWTQQARLALAEARTHLAAHGPVDDVEFLVTIGADWPSAVASVAWKDGDILVVGSSSTHRLAQVFLGSSAAKIVRNAPVPVVVIPGTAS